MAHSRAELAALRDYELFIFGMTQGLSGTACHWCDWSNDPGCSVDALHQSW
jgi:hypothetical protein